MLLVRQALARTLREVSVLRAGSLLALLVVVPAVLKLSAAQEHAPRPPSTSPPPGCAVGDCGLRSSSAYPELVIGVVQHVYDEGETRDLYRWGKLSKTWRDFDDDLQDFQTRNRVVRITVGESKTPFILVTSRTEHDGAPPLRGDLVRYVPLGPHHDAVGRKAPSPFSILAGCIAILCRQADAPCFVNYEQGFFSKATGVEISLGSGKPVPAGKVVDPVTALPRK